MFFKSNNSVAKRYVESPQQLILKNIPRKVTIFIPTEVTYCMVISKLMQCVVNCNYLKCFCEIKIGLRKILKVIIFACLRMLTNIFTLVRLSPPNPTRTYLLLLYFCISSMSFRPEVVCLVLF